MSQRIVYRAAGACFVCVVALAAAVLPSWGQQGNDAAQQKVAAIKQSLQTSMATLRGYEWIETTTVSIKGDQKSHKQNRCYYGADGKEVKVPIDDGSSSDKKKPRGLRGRIVEKKTDEMQDYVEKVMALIKQYVPPDPQKLQAVQAKGAEKTTVMDNAAKIRAEFPDYLKNGDALAVTVDPDHDRIVGMSVSSYIDDDPKDAVKLDVTFAAFADGTVYPAKIDVAGESKNLEIAVVNDGYRKTGS